MPSASPGLEVSSYVDGSIAGRLSARDRAESSSALVNSLSYSRPGAPRAWSGDKGTTGSVTVGPYVTVNNMVCRDFTHTVTIDGAPVAKKGTACRDASNNWSVAG